MTPNTAVAHEISALEAIHHRRAVRSYRPDTVDDATIQTLLDAAVHAPTAMHQEPWAFVVVQNRDLLRSISDRAKALMLSQATAHRDLLRAPGAAPLGRLIETLGDPNFNIFYDAGTLIIICGKPLGDFVVADCWLAAENLMLAASSLGFGTCPIGFALPALHEVDVKKELGIPKGTDAVAAVIVGVPRGETPPVPRKPPEVIRWVRESRAGA